MRHVLVTTEFRGVFFGQLAEERLEQDGAVAVLENARCAIYWATTGGFVELAVKGPNERSKVGSAAPRITLRKVTSVTDCTEEAVRAWGSR